jgi:hypothetical protein
MPCNHNGYPITDLEGVPPPPPDTELDPNNWAPYENWMQFETAEFLFTQEQISGGNIDALLKLWAATLVVHDDAPPFTSHKAMYETINSTNLGNVQWESFTIKYGGLQPDHDVPDWMMAENDIWFRDPLTLVHNMLSNPDFKDEFDYAPFQGYD